MSRRVLPWTWRSDEKTARLAFWVADAPHHDSRKAEMADALRDTHDVGVHIYAVAASGVDELTEDTMRSAAELTGGRYLFLTNDSGVGGAHKEPEIPCYFATHLDDAILRMVDIELTVSIASRPRARSSAPEAIRRRASARPSPARTCRSSDA